MAAFPMLLLGMAGVVTACMSWAVFVLPPPPSGLSGLDAVVLMLMGVTARWVLLAGLVAYAALRGAFDWVRARSRGWRVTGVLGAHAVLGGLSLVSLLAFVDSGEMIPGGDSRLHSVLMQIAQFGCTLPALGVMAYVAAAGRPAPVLTAGAGGGLAVAGAGVLAGLLVVGGIWVTSALQEQERAERDVQQDLQRVAETRARFAALTDEDPLWKWREFLTPNVPPDVSAEAFRRLSARPTLERDFAEAMGCDCGNPAWAVELLWMFVTVPFTPDAALGEPVAHTIGTMAAYVRESARTAREDERDAYVDRYLGRDLLVARQAALLMARSAKVDLRPALMSMRQAVVESYPKSEAARQYPGEVDGTLREIGAALGEAG